MELNRKESVFCHNGYIYFSRYTKGNIRYLFCKNKVRWGCKASLKVIISEERIVMINAEHNHPASEEDVEKINFKQALKDACLKEMGDLKSIYNKIARRFANTALYVPYNSVRSSMARWRRVLTPNVPRTLPHLGEILNSGQWPKYTICDRGPFFSGTVTCTNGDSAIIFGNPEFINQFSNSQYVFIDGTFKSVPRRPNFSQIVTIFATCMDHAFPLIHIFMANKTRALYDAVFGYIKATFPNFINDNIMTDFESGLVESLRGIYPNASLHGCFFHYCQAVFRKARALHIIQRIQNDPNGQMLLKKYYALPLLPAEMIANTLATLQQGNDELTNLFRDLHNYIINFWVRRITPQRFSVFDQRHRTNNVMESYHRRLNSKLVRHPNVWDLIDTLIGFQNTALLEFGQLERGQAVFRVASRNSIFHSRLREAWAKLADGRFTADDFLRQAVHFTDGLHRNFYFWERNEDDATNRPINTDEQHPPLEQNEPPPLLPLASTSSSTFHRISSVQNPPIVQPLRNVSLSLPSTSAAAPSLYRPLNEPPPLFYFNQNEISPENAQTPPLPGDVEMVQPLSPLQHIQSPREAEMVEPVSPPQQLFLLAEDVEEVEPLSPLQHLPFSGEAEVNEPLPPSQNSPYREEADMVEPVSSPQQPFLLTEDVEEVEPLSPLQHLPILGEGEVDEHLPPSQNSPYREGVDMVEPVSPPQQPFLLAEDVEEVEPLSPEEAEVVELIEPLSPLQNPPTPEEVQAEVHYNFPPIPEPVARLFATLGVDEDADPNLNFLDRWTPSLETIEFTDDMVPSMRCCICYLNTIRYAMQCGHLFCPNCAARLFNQENPRCGVCRTGISQEPVPLYFII